MASATHSGPSTANPQRYTAASPCPICQGTADGKRGTGTRCTGILSSDGEYARCSREEHAGGLPLDGATTPASYAHKLYGPCKCGKTHREKEKLSYFERLIESYVYRGPDGKARFKVDRLRPKDFVQWHPDDATPRGWKAGVKGIELVPYRLPELLARPGDPVHVVEGEKDADRLGGIGLLATCNAAGAGKWRDAYSAHLRGRTVYILPDNDDPGRDHAEKVAASLKKVDAKVKVVELPGLAEKGDVSDWLAAGGTAEALAALAAAAPEWKPSPARPALKLVGAESDGAAKTRRRKGAGQVSPRPTIEINTERYRALDEAVAALGGDPDLYDRGEKLVSVAQDAPQSAREPGDDAIADPAPAPKIIQLSDAIVGCRLTKVADFIRWSKDENGEYVSADVHPPDWLIKAVATKKHWPGLRRLVGVAECPFPRPDGSIVEARGYDAETQTLLYPAIGFLSIPKRPTRSDAMAAWGRISSYVGHFPFATEDDRVVYLAGVLTVIGRPAIPGVVPGIAVIGNKAGTGKGLLIDGMTIPGTGRGCPTSAYPYESDEAVKVKVSIAKSGKPAVHFDNLTEGSQYGHGALDSALTSIVVDDRQLGGNECPPVPLRTTWFLSGNNVTPYKDAYRRWLVCNLQTTLDHPEERAGLPRFRQVISEHRAEIVRDALTILRAHSSAGRPHPVWPGFGSFEDWDNVIRGAVWFATDRDCLTTQRQTAAESPDRANQVALLEGLLELTGARMGQRGVTCQEAVTQVEKSPESFPILHAALTSYGKQGKLANSVGLGSILRGMVNTPVGPYKLIKHPTLKHKVVAWLVEYTEPSDPDEGGDGGQGGYVSGPPTRDFRSYADAMIISPEPQGRLAERESPPPTPPHPPLALPSAPGLEDGEEDL